MDPILARSYYPLMSGGTGYPFPYPYALGWYEECSIVLHNRVPKRGHLWVTYGSLTNRAFGPV
jgi:hypothetical protein